MKSSVPVMVKLSPNVTDIAEMARAVEDGRHHLRREVHAHPQGVIAVHPARVVSYNFV